MGKSITSTLVTVGILTALVACVLAAGTILILRHVRNARKPTLQANGGTILVYDVDTANLNAADTEALADRVIRVLRRRLDPEGRQNIVWRPLSETRIEVRIPRPSEKTLKTRDAYINATKALRDAGIDVADAMWAADMRKGERLRRFNELSEGSADKLTRLHRFAAAYHQYLPFMDHIQDAESLQRLLGGWGALEFRVLPTQGHPQVDAEQVEQCLKRLEEEGPEASQGRYVWCRISDSAAWLTPETMEEDAGVNVQDEQGNPPFVRKVGEEYYVLAANAPDESMLYAPGRDAWTVQNAFPALDNMGRRAVQFQLDAKGGELFASLTAGNIGRPLCILLDGSAVSAPVVQTQIHRQGIIAGRFTEQEVRSISNVINAGSLPALLVTPPISVTTVDPPVRNNKP